MCLCRPSLLTCHADAQNELLRFQAFIIAFPASTVKGNQQVCKCNR